MRRSIRAFTLVELLIVTAIITILAAIAMPTYLESQTRSKVSKAKADMHSVAVAIEAYKIDHNRYPLGAQLTNPSVYVFQGSEEVIESLLPSTIMTPVAYLSALPRDPFPPKSAGEGGGETAEHSFHYLDRYTSVVRGAPNIIDQYQQAIDGKANPSVAWSMLALGPDLDHDEDLSPTGEYPAARYDPTNGTLSNGDIYAFEGEGQRN